MNRFFPTVIFAVLLAAFLPSPASAQRQMEKLGRGMIVVHSATSQAYIGWRLLGDDPAGIGFNLYRSANGGAAVKLNGSVLTASTNFSDTTANFTQTNAYYVKPVVNGIEGAAGMTFTLTANTPVQQWLTVPLQIPPGGTSPPSADGESAGGPYTYTANDASVGDLDGDGEYEIVLKWDPNNSKDNSQGGFTGNTYLDAYKLNGTRMWRIDLGVNIRSGAHYMDFMVFDFDGDGKAEIMCRTAPGSRDGLNAYVGGAAKWQGGARPAFNDTDDYRDASGYILKGPEFISVFAGPTGTELATARFFPQRDPDNLDDNPSSSRLDAIWEDGYGNRVDRFLAGVAYVDGQRPSGIFTRGYYTRTFLSAWDWRGGQLTRRWSFDSNSSAVNKTYAGQGGHSLSIGDLDGDGKDEIAFGACAIDDNGTGLFTTKLGHGDATHMSDMDPDDPGLKFFMPHEGPGAYGIYGTSLVDQRTGKILWGAPGGGDVGRGVAADIDPRYPGYEAWATNSSSVYSVKGVAIPTTSRPSVNFLLWWDGDLSRELLDGTKVDKWNGNGGVDRLMTISGAGSINGTKATPNLSGDILGDWREEIVMRTTDNSALRIYTTTNVATNRLYTLMHDPQYREAIAWQNTGYNQPPHPGFFLGQDMPAPPRAPIWNGNLVWKGAPGSNVWDAGVSARWLRGTGTSTFAPSDSVLFDLSGDTSSVVTLSNGGVLAPSEVVVHNPLGKDYTFDGAGSLSGTTTLTKAGLGSLTLKNSHAYTGDTMVQQGDLNISGTLSGSKVIVEGLGRVGGTGTLARGLTVKARGRISPGMTGTTGTLTVGGRLDLTNANLDFDIGATPAASRDSLVSGTLALSGTSKLNFNRLNGTIQPGTYPLISYQTLSGSLSNLVVTGLAGAPGTLSTTGSSIVLTVAATRTANSLTWRGSGATWNLAASQNWLFGSTPDYFVTGDVVLFNLTGTASPAVTVAEELYPGSVTVDAASNYTFSGPGSLTGTGGLTKTNLGKLTMQTANGYTGPTTVNGGTFELASVGASGNATTLGAAGVSPANLVLNSGTLRFTGSISATDRGMTVNSGGGTIDVTSSSASLILSGTILGSGTLTKTGPGTLNLAGINRYSGGTVISGGQVLLGSNAANRDGLGSGVVTLRSGTLSMNNVESSQTCTWPLYVPTTGRLNTDDRCTLTGALTGSGTLTYQTTFTRPTLSGNWSAFTGRINVVTGSEGGDFRISNSSGYANAAINFANLVTAYSTTGSTNIGEVSGSVGSVMSATAWTVGARNTDATFAGNILGNSVTKVGNGTWTLTGSNTYTGPTSVQGGFLVINGFLNGSTVTVQSGGTLGGTGGITGNVVINPGGTMIANASGALTINGNLTNNGVVRFTGGRAATVNGTFTNNGVLDLITGAQSLPVNFINNGTVVDSSTVQANDITLTGANVGVTIQSYLGHNYQLQKRDGLTSGTWVNVGSAQAGNGGILSFGEIGAATGGQRFYRVVISP